ncbi:expressed unknown protein [Seminavis robusta]|uniref:Uncharacterized protein n=1 Tax=Seminavis robusta TaxID=568900 RepID=A0A9N8ECJ6_9STRA|nr:expressed unknown protein [Seminavis robusta]|eukprot:Sro747_g196560.1 n/a (119) ;mRNA; r:32474-32830
MMMKQSLTFVLSFVFLGLATAAPESSQQDKAPVTRVRRGLINVKQQQADELKRLTNEFGEGNRDLEEEDMAALLGEDMSFSFEDMSFSYDYEEYEEVEETGGGKGKGKGKGKGNGASR